MSLFPLGLISQGGGAAGNALELISTAYGTGSSGTITFSSIPAGYKHLQLRYVALSGQANWCYILLNGDSGANYASHYLQGNGSSVSSGSLAPSQSNMGFMALAGNSTPGMGIIDFLDVSSSTKNKTVRSLHAFPTNPVALSSGVWLSTSAVTSVTLVHPSSTYSTASRFSLYGVS